MNQARALDQCVAERKLLQISQADQVREPGIGDDCIAQIQIG